jgi:hypothetical protein
MRTDLDIVNNMKEQLGYRYRIYPDARQARLFRMTVGCCVVSVALLVDM